MVNKIINEKERQIKYSDRKQTDILSVLNILRIVYYTCMIVGIFYLAIFTYQIFTEKTAKDNFIYTAKVYVYDGDTVTYQNEKIRILCINAPEIQNIHRGTKDEPFSREAKDILVGFLEKNEMIIQKCKGRDKYGRKLCEIIGEDNTNIGLEMVSRGYARAYFCTNKEYLVAQEEAQKRRLGIWATYKN